MLESPDRSAMELKTLEDWVLERQYKSVPGVADDSGARRPDDAVPGAARSGQAGRGRPLRAADRRRRSARTTATPAAASTRRAASSTTCADSAASQTPEDIGNVVARRAQRHAGPGQGRRPTSSSATRRASGSSASTSSDEAVEGVILHAQGRAGAGRSSTARREEDGGAEPLASCRRT